MVRKASRRRYSKGDRAVHKSRQRLRDRITLILGDYDLKVYCRICKGLLLLDETNPTMAGCTTCNMEFDLSQEMAEMEKLVPEDRSNPVVIKAGRKSESIEDIEREELESQGMQVMGIQADYPQQN